MSNLPNRFNTLGQKAATWAEHAGVVLFSSCAGLALLRTIEQARQGNAYATLLTGIGTLAALFTAIGWAKTRQVSDRLETGPLHQARQMYGEFHTSMRTTQEPLMSAFALSTASIHIGQIYADNPLAIGAGLGGTLLGIGLCLWAKNHNERISDRIGPLPTRSPGMV